jgi:hypothetical protein
VNGVAFGPDDAVILPSTNFGLVVVELPAITTGARHERMDLQIFIFRTLSIPCHEVLSGE